MSKYSNGKVYYSRRSFLGVNRRNYSVLEKKFSVRIDAEEERMALDEVEAEVEERKRLLNLKEK